MDLLSAVNIIERDGSSEADIKKAWVFMVDSGHCWQLQGWYQRTAHNLIEDGLIDNWRQKIAELEIFKEVKGEHIRPAQESKNSSEDDVR